MSRREETTVQVFIKAVHKKDGERSDNDAGNEDDDIICKRVEAVFFYEKGFPLEPKTFFFSKIKATILELPEKYSFVNIHNNKRKRLFLRG